jgi:predicted nucleotidyltransferase
MVPEPVLNEAVRRLVVQFGPTRIILFGSQARGTADDRSDVDLLVICPVNGRRRELMVAMDRALTGLGIARDIVILTPEEFEMDRDIPGTIARPAWLEGRVLYDSAA